MMGKFQLVWLMRMRIAIVLVKFFRRVEFLKKEQRAAIKFCVKLKKTTTETFQMMKSACIEERLPRTNVFEWHEMSKEAQKMRM
jgi:hypothetical protein